jgi:hypothetical protein
METSCRQTALLDFSEISQEILLLEFLHFSEIQFFRKKECRLLGKMPLIKKAHKKISLPRAGLMTGMSHLADLGNMAQEESKSGPGIAFYRRGRVRVCCMRRGP